MSQFNVVIVSSRNEVRQICERYLSSYNYISIVSHSSLKAFEQWAPKKAFSILLVDLATIFKSSAEERQYLYDIQNSVPVVRLRFDSETKSIQGSFKAINDADQTLFAAIERSIQLEKNDYFVRVNQRRKFILNVRILPNEKNQLPVLVNTEDLSVGGAFLIGNFDWAEGQQIFLEFNELDDKTPIPTEIRWINKWGKSTLRFAGLGVEFKSMTESQRTQLNHMIGGSLSDANLTEVIEELNRLKGNSKVSGIE